MLTSDVINAGNQSLNRFLKTENVDYSGDAVELIDAVDQIQKMSDDKNEFNVTYNRHRSVVSVYRKGVLTSQHPALPVYYAKAREAIFVALVAFADFIQAD